MVDETWDRVRAAKPLVHCITNFVSMDVSNVARVFISMCLRQSTSLRIVRHPCAVMHVLRI